MWEPTTDFAEFYRASGDDGLRTVLIVVGDRDTADAMDLIFPAVNHDV
jgi:hypothetical protein